MSIGRRINNNRILILECLDQLENSIIFAKLRAVDWCRSLIKTDKINKMLQKHRQIYLDKNVLHFVEILAYYLIIGTQVFFWANKIIFALYFPLTQP